MEIRCNRCGNELKVTFEGWGEAEVEPCPTCIDKAYVAGYGVGLHEDDRYGYNTAKGDHYA